ncbi:neutral zinc metallopeptidase [Corynebacterium liangguodongii]|uniref:Metalloprotease n=1 Tax=Corynebacterium liangguodongii TaxID=2079535 RepID=A0A2S0WEB0_9CORY|nr:neutral zinc metallopeptidase [Corynebacterium liangguodongii]AWB84108.1 metalloprotease [Corynebacterium liangguodongii]PWC00119.1 metalloprotease [Corynebacterium liangguodongii]
MTFKDSYQRSGNRATTSSGGRGAAPMVIGGGGIGTLILLGLFLLLGGDPSGGQLPAPQSQGQGQSGAAAEYNLDHCNSPGAANEYDDCRIEATAVSVDSVWQEVLPAEAGTEYVQPGMHIFQQAVSTGCGNASANTGPFYCPADTTAYFDVSFFNQLGQFGGSDAPLAQMYVVAHEFGHHIQQLEGTLKLSNYNQPGEDSAAVAIELQADCYAGLWASHADKGENAILEPITKDQLSAAIQTARAVGDDNIQKRSGGDVNPDVWTHGSSEQREEAFLAGYEGGHMSSCDYLGRGGYA